MACYAIKDFKAKLRNGSRSTEISYSPHGSLTSKVPQNEYEAKKQIEDWIARKYPGYQIIDLKVTYLDRY